MESTQENILAPLNLSDNQKHIIRQLLYYSIFNYPLETSELDSYSTNNKLETELATLEEKQLIGRKENLFGIAITADQIQRRKTGVEAAKAVYPKAAQNARKIFNFPFVKGVYVSGSLSKGFLSEDGDIDYFIITKPGKLWLSRTLLILYKKLFLLNSRKYFCVNYFVDANHLEITEKNIFTATELATLIPYESDGVNDSLISDNKWVESFYRNKKIKFLGNTEKHETGFKKLAEFLLNNWFGNQLDTFCMWLTMKVWERKFGNFKPDDFDLAMKSRRYVSKHHPQNFQKKVLDAFAEKVSAFETKHNVDLSL